MGKTMKKITVSALGAVSAMALMAGVAHADPNLIVNGSFETGDFTGWTAVANSYPMTVDGSHVEDGDFGAQIAGFSYGAGPDTLTQTVGTTGGEVYLLSFWRTIEDGRPTVSLDVTWNGASVFSELNPGAQPFQNFTALVVGTGSDTLQFISANDPAFTYLDNVSLTDTGRTSAAPEPAAWALMIAGFGLAGAALRAKRRNAVSA